MLWNTGVMRAISYSSFDALPEIIEVPDPVCPVEGAVVRVAATGVCRSDWHAWKGHDDSVVLPQIPGHEFAGTVSEVGSAVTRVAVGDRVTAAFVFACGECEQCREGATQVCLRQEQPGFTLDGSYAEALVVPNADLNLVRLPTPSASSKRPGSAAVLGLPTTRCMCAGGSRRGSGWRCSAAAGWGCPR